MRVSASPLEIPPSWGYHFRATPRWPATPAVPCFRNQEPIPITEVTVISAPAPCTFGEVRRSAAPVLRKAGAKRAIVFGSWARGQADGYSDLDLAVVMETDLPRPQRALALAKELDRALPVVVDLLVYTPDEFAAGEADPYGVFDLFRHEGVEILRSPDDR